MVFLLRVSLANLSLQYVNSIDCTMRSNVGFSIGGGHMGIL